MRSRRCVGHLERSTTPIAPTVALVATLARLYVGVVLIDRECECRGHRRRIVGVVYDHMCQQQCDQRIGYAAGGNMSQIGARSAYLALRDFDPKGIKIFLQMGLDRQIT